MSSSRFKSQHPLAFLFCSDGTRGRSSRWDPIELRGSSSSSMCASSAAFLPILCNFFSLRLFFYKISVEVTAAPFEEVLKFDISIIGRCSNEELFLSKIMDWEVPEIATYYASELWLKSFFFPRSCLVDAYLLKSPLKYSFT